MKKHYFIITLILTASLVFSVVTVSSAKATESTAVKPSEATEKIYILKDFNGRLALFENNSNIPLEVFDIFTSSLPQKDIERLNKGIETSYDELERVLEEYLS